MLDRADEICAEIHAVRHGPRSAGSALVPLSKRLLLQSLPLRDGAIKAHIERVIIAEQESAANAINSRIGAEGGESAVVDVDLIDNFRQEAEREMTLASEQMADALLARCIIETCADLEKEFDLSAFLGTRTN